MQRVGTMAGNPQLKLTEKERTLMTINVQVFVHSMIGLVEVLLNYGDILLPYDVRQSIMAFLHQSPVELMSSMVPNKEEKQSNKNPVGVKTNRYFLIFIKLVTVVAHAKDLKQEQEDVNEV